MSDKGGRNRKRKRETDHNMDLTCVKGKYKAGSLARKSVKTFL